MFQRLVFENSAALFTLVAFITAASIFVTIAWRALRMKRAQLARFENLPFEVETPCRSGFTPDTNSSATPRRA
ncbi:MAG TPA: hypothetical protein VHD62_04280 [Opitutaceae bacterium]|nr:hypothetical protein [Opitutaceae bacterium]